MLIKMLNIDDDDGDNDCQDGNDQGDDCKNDNNNDNDSKIIDDGITDRKNDNDDGINCKGDYQDDDNYYKNAIDDCMNDSQNGIDTYDIDYKDDHGDDGEDHYRKTIIGNGILIMTEIIMMERMITIAMHLTG